LKNGKPGLPKTAVLSSMSTRYRFMRIAPSLPAPIVKQRIEAPLKETEPAFPFFIPAGM
jgi:hypothetical protein